MAEDRRFRSGSLVFPVLLIAIGALILYAKWHPEFNVWAVLWMYWPLILIFAGIGKIWDYTRPGNDSNVSRAGSVGASIGVLVFVIVLVVLVKHGRRFAHERGFDRELEHVHKVVERGKAESARVTVQIGAGELRVDGGANDLLDADFVHGASYSTPQVDTWLDGKEENVQISPGDETIHVAGGHNEWNLHFAKEIPLSMVVQMGAGEARMNFREVNLTELELHIGAGHVEVDLTGDRKKDVNVDLQGGAGEAIVRVPKNLGVEARASGAIGTVTARGLTHDEDEYKNEAYGKSPVTIHLNVSGAVGQIVLEQEP